jgi:hypothetical protein
MMRQLLLVMFAALIGLAITCAVPAGADPTCPKNIMVRVQGQDLLPRPADQICDDDQTGGGLLGNAPVVGNLPGVGGIL